jgi:hypothetical protein
VEFTDTSDVTVNGNGSLEVTGSAQSGTGVALKGSSLRLTGGKASITGTSETGDGVDLINATTTKTTGSGQLGSSGQGNMGVYISNESSINTRDPGSLTSILGYSTSPGHGVDIGSRTEVSGVVPIETDDINISGGVTSTTGGASLVICSNNNCVFRKEIEILPVIHGDRDNYGAVVAGAVLAGGMAAFLSGGEDDPYLYLLEPDSLEVAEGDLAFWADTGVEYVLVYLDTGTAEVQLLTQAGLLKRELKYKDAADGVNHYAWQSGNMADNIQSALSVNLKTQEYFYTETGIRAGQPYSVKAHGWLKRGLPPEMVREQARNGK